MTLPDALDQILWDNPPIGVVPGRVATGDTVLGGQEIRAGELTASVEVSDIPTGPPVTERAPEPAGLILAVGALPVLGLAVRRLRRG